MADIDPKIADGSARSPGIQWPDLMKIDGRPAPEMLTRESYQYRGSEPLDTKRYTCPDYAALEREKMWPHVWQFAAREEDLPEAGDYIVFENAGRSWLVSRQDDGSVKAMHNVCLHRGRKLRLEDGTADTVHLPVPRLFMGQGRRVQGNALRLGLCPSEQGGHAIARS